MVVSRVPEERGEPQKQHSTPMTNITSGEGSSHGPLQNLDPIFPKWGTQKILRCVKVPERRSLEVDTDTGNRKLDVLISEESDEGIETVKEKVMLDLRTKVDQVKDSIFGKKNFVPELDHGSPAAVVEQQDARPWNLRARKPKKGSGNGSGSGSGSVARGGKAVERKKRFSVKLSDAEIKEDYIILFGRRPPRRPSRRPKNVQKDLDYVFPGLSLGEVKVEKYMIPERKVKK